MVTQGHRKHRHLIEPYEYDFLFDFKSMRSAMAERLDNPALWHVSFRGGGAGCISKLHFTLYFIL